MGRDVHVLTLDRCREILGKDCKLSDEEVTVLRDQLYVIAEVALEAFQRAEVSRERDLH